MNATQALDHNRDISEKIKELQGELVGKYRIRVVERLSDGRREFVEDETTEFIKQSDTRIKYDDYRALYSDTKRFFIVIDEVDIVRRRVDVRLPQRTDADRQPPSHIKDPTEEQMK